MDYKYRVYYATSPNGPWTLSNDTLIDHADIMTYTVEGLNSNTIYYILIVGGIEDTDFIPLVTQSIGPYATGAKTLESLGSVGFGVKTFASKQTDSNGFTQTFEVV